MSNLVYEGPVRIYSAKKDGTPYTYSPKSGPNAGKPTPFDRLAITPQGVDMDGNQFGTVYLADFGRQAAKAEVTDGAIAKVAYSLKVNEYEEPIRFPNEPDGALQYDLEAIKLVDAAPKTEAAPAKKDSYDPNLGSYQTALNCSTQLHAALIQAGVPMPDDIIGAVISEAQRLHGYLVTGDDPGELDMMLAKAKETFSDEKIEMPGPDVEDEFKGTF